MRLRSALTLLSLAAVAPVLVCAAMAAAYVYQQQSASLVSATTARNRATLEAVDAEIRGTIGVLRALAGSAALARDDLEAFHHEARITHQTQAHWHNILLSTPDGTQRVSTRHAWGTPLQTEPVDRRSLDQVVTSRLPAIGDLTFAPAPGGAPGIPIRIPVMRDGECAYVLTAVWRPQAVRQILINQNLPSDWRSGIVGTDGRLIARVPSGDPGTLASAEYRRRTADAAEGWYRGLTLDGLDTFTAFSRSSFTGWSIGFAIPAETVLSAARGPAILLGAGVVLSTLSALLIGVWLARRISRPIAELAQAAPMIGGPVKPPPVRSTIDEVQQLSTAVARTADAIAERDRQLALSRDESERQSEELRARDGNRSRFLALLSHELRNPLAPLRNGLELLKLDADPDRRVATQAIMERQVTVMARLIDDLLDVGRIDRGQLKLQLASVSLPGIARNASEAVMPALLAKRHDLRLQLPARDIRVMGDAVRLEQVMVNLLSNAAKYTQAEGRIELAIAADTAEATVAVSDNGCGFDPADSDRIFELFTRLPGADRDAGGLGIGLSIARALVELHGGRISARSDGPGSGAVFQVVLPRVEAPAEEAAPAAREQPATGSRRVLVADDNPDAADVLAELIRMLGHEAIVARDGREAVDLVEGSRPAIAFLDIGMPRMDGLEAARRIRASHPQLVLVALTGLGQLADREATRDAGFDCHLVKPATLADIGQLVPMSRADVRAWSSRSSRPA